MSDRIAVIGAGLIGRAWAIVFARAGRRVALYDLMPDVARGALDRIEANLADLARAGLVDDPPAILARIAPVATVEEALAGALHVQENGPEDVAMKEALFKRLDAVAAPDVVLASSSSAIRASAFTKGLAGAHRCLVAHPVNPPHLVPVVELCGAPWTSAEVVARARTIYESVDQAPITVNREIEGFVLNRLQVALLSEAFRLVGEGVVSPQDLDKTLSDGLGLRWSFMGPFQTIELNAPGGIPDYCARYGDFFRRTTADPPTPAVWSEENLARVMRAWGRSPTKEEVARRTAWRDKRLTALMAHKRAQPDG